MMILDKNMQPHLVRIDKMKTSTITCNKNISPGKLNKMTYRKKMTCVNSSVHPNRMSESDFHPYTSNCKKNIKLKKKKKKKKKTTKKDKKVKNLK